MKSRLEIIPKLRFARLTTIIKTDERRYGNVVWLCKCDCGKEILTIAKSLRDGSTKSCGCLKIDLVRKRMIGNKISVTHGLSNEKKTY